tara:strand:+ start:988 stop:1176 length:189 start_codon:yes stop_codon:yes gene_type:complete
MKQIYNNNLILIANIIKAITGVIGASLILAEDMPYIALSTLSIGAGINEFLLFVEKTRKRDI